MLNRQNPLGTMQQADWAKARSLYSRCESGDPDACNQLSDPKYSGLLMGGPLKSLSPQGYSEGGEVEESLLGKLPEASAMEAPATEDYVEDDPLAPYQDILGEEGYMELLAAISDYPVVATIAEMATKTSDGYVEGMGGPKDDIVPAKLSDGEYVFSAEAVDAIGLDNLEALHEQAKAMAASQG